MYIKLQILRLYYADGFRGLPVNNILTAFSCLICIKTANGWSQVSCMGLIWIIIHLVNTTIPKIQINMKKD